MAPTVRDSAAASHPHRAVSRRLVTTGAVIAVVYLVTAGITLQLGPRRLRPLFDGFAPPPPYNWVKPPPEFADANQKPSGSTSRVSLVGDSSQTTGTGTPDGQALVTLPAGAIPARPGATEAELKLEPLDAGTLVALPEGLQAHSNAYRLTATYQPNGAPIASFAKPGSVALTAATAVTTLLYSADGRSWQTIPSKAFGQNPGLTGALAAPGYVVVAGGRSPTTAPPSTSSPSNRALLIVGIALVVVGVGGGGARRRHRSPTAFSAETAATSGRAGEPQYQRTSAAPPSHAMPLHARGSVRDRCAVGPRTPSVGCRSGSRPGARASLSLFLGNLSSADERGRERGHCGASRFGNPPMLGHPPKMAGSSVPRPNRNRPPITRLKVAVRTDTAT